mmetsp:Transcript_10699/g.25161  ORF Transcript_10699/g.25161 Transcript_10699/m.25161 type:complete len:99 (+) Transcript_10699:795-1091(+)
MDARMHLNPPFSSALTTLPVRRTPILLGSVVASLSTSPVQRSLLLCPVGTGVRRLLQLAGPLLLLAIRGDEGDVMGSIRMGMLLMLLLLLLLLDLPRK